MMLPEVYLNDNMSGNITVLEPPLMLPEIYLKNNLRQPYGIGAHDDVELQEVSLKDSLTAALRY